MGLAALRSGSGIRAQFTSPPYVHIAQQEGAKQILSGEEAFGDRFTFIVGVASPFWGEKRA
jgi:hypothetical protein